MKTISAVAALAIVGLVACQDATQPPVDDTSTLAVTASGTKKYWFSDYFPLIPGLYGIKTYEFTVGQTGQFTSQVVGTETVQYSTGAITGTRITFLGGILGGTGTLSVFRSEKRLLSPLRSLQDRVPSTTCGELVYPPDVSFGQVHDGMILDRRGVGNFEVNINDLNDCEELGFGDSFVDLIQIRDVHISGKRYNNAIVAWELEPKEYPGLRFRSLNLGGKEQEWGLTPLPTAAETNDWVVDDVVIYGHRVGILAVGLIEAETGGLNAAIELISVTRSSATFPSATGSGHFLDFRFAEPLLRTFSFNAKTGPDGSGRGQWQLQNRNSAVRIHGDVECVSVAGNQAWFAGPTTQSDRPGQIGVTRFFTVVDNGQGNASPPDQLAFVPGSRTFPAQDWCDNMPVRTLVDIESGNIQVR